MRNFKFRFKLMKRIKIDPWGNFLRTTSYNNMKFFLIGFYSFRIKSFLYKLLKIYWTRQLPFRFLIKDRKNFLHISSLKNFLDDINKSLSLKEHRKKFLFSNLYKNTIFKDVMRIRRVSLKKRSTRTLYGAKILILKKIRMFYGFIPYNQIKNSIKSNIRLSFFSGLNFFLNLENRIDVILYRMNLFSSVFELKRFILSGLVKVNKKVIFSNNFKLQNLDFLSIDQTKRSFLFYLLMYRLGEREIYLNAPLYLEINYSTLSCIFLSKLLKFKNIFYPLNEGGQFFRLFFHEKLF